MMAKFDESSSYGISDIPSLKKDDDSIDDLPIQKKKSASNYTEDDFESSSSH